MKIRDITNADIPVAISLLCEGFPKKNKKYWQRAFDVLADRPHIQDIPIFGLALETDGAVQGLMLLIASNRRGKVFCNLSSWYVRPPYRKYSPFLFQRALRLKNTSFTDCSPAEHVLPIITKFGFKPYSYGTILIDARACFRLGKSVRNLNADSLKDIDPVLRDIVESHLSYGCRGFLTHAQDSFAEPVLYRTTRLKRLVPAARFVFGSPATIVANVGGLARALLKRGVPVMLVDRPCSSESNVGRILANYGGRYVKGSDIPPVGDLLDTEIGLFGF